MKRGESEDKFSREGGLLIKLIRSDLLCGSEFQGSKLLLTFKLNDQDAPLNG